MQGARFDGEPQEVLIGLPAAVPIAEGTIALGEEVPGGQVLGVEGHGRLARSRQAGVSGGVGLPLLP
jgi:hypothetical protein